MPWKEPERWMLVVGVSLFSGIVRFCIDIRRGKIKSAYFSTLIGQIIVSGFVGFMAGLLVIESVKSESTAVAIAGICGSMGADFLKMLQARFKNKVVGDERKE